jgi:hypothetical protein
MGRERRDDLKLPEEENGNKFYKLVWEYSLTFLGL